MQKQTEITKSETSRRLCEFCGDQPGAACPDCGRVVCRWESCEKEHEHAHEMPYKQRRRPGTSKLHRSMFPAQYSHPLCGKRVIVIRDGLIIAEGVVARVIAEDVKGVILRGTDPTDSVNWYAISEVSPA